MNITDSQIREDLIYLYRDYEQKILSRHQIMDYVRDVYYIDSTGKSYEEWLEERTRVVRGEN